jgi:hypothetical protein
MSTSRMASLVAFGAMLATAWAACGGTAVIDAPEDDDSSRRGDPGAGGSGNGGSDQGVGASSASSMSRCPTPAPQGALEWCGATATSTGPGGMLQCDTVMCDMPGGQSWWSSCTQTGCDCKYDDEVVCTCTFSMNEGCTVPTCCPAPWQG